MSKWKDKNTNNLAKAFLSLKTEEECYAFMEDLCTIKEIIEMSKRLKVAGMLKNKKSYTDIIKETGVSAATISRINKCYEYGCGGYKVVLERINGEKKC